MHYVIQPNIISSLYFYNQLILDDDNVVLQDIVYNNGLST